MKLGAELLINDLKERSHYVINSAKALDAESDEVVGKRPTPEAWNAIECLVHLNRYSDFYLPEIRQRMQASKLPPAEVFKSGFLGGKFAEALLPRDPKDLNRMNTFKSMNPIGEVANREVIRRFIADQEELLNLLEAARQKNLNRVRTSITISRFIRLRLGDTLRVVVYHNHRHMHQAQRATGTHA